MLPSPVEYFTVHEEQKPGTLVGNITVRENFSYRFSSENDYFSINSRTGSICTKRSIDRERLVKDEMEFVVLSSAPVYPIEVKVRILDINDHSPKFSSSVFQIDVPESQKVGTVIPISSAVDLDSVKNGLTDNYSIISGNDTGKFSLEILYNVLHLKILRRLDRETENLYQLNISAVDRGSPPRYGYTLLNITITDENDNAPLFNPTTFRASLWENSTIGTYVVQVNATDVDMDSNGEVKYQIEVDNVHQTHKKFEIDPQTGIIKTAELIDREANTGVKDRYTIYVIATDGGNPPLQGRATVSVIIYDVNDNAPQILFSFANPESTKSGYVKVKEEAVSFFAFPSVSDQDSSNVNGPIKVVITKGDEQNHFELHTLSNSSGTITMAMKANAIIDREKKDKYNLTIEATDSGNPPQSSVANLIVLVTDVNDHKPQFSKLVYTATIKEGIPIGSYVGEVSASDSDISSNGEISYSIVSGNEKGWFAVSKATGLVTTSNEIDSDIFNDSNIVLEIIAKDNGAISNNSSVIFNVSIQDVNDNRPNFGLSSNFTVSLSENLEIGSKVFDINATDLDSGLNGFITYELFSEYQIAISTFQIDNKTGLVTLKQRLDREQLSSYSLQIVARDLGTPPFAELAHLKVIVLDENDSQPKFYPENYFVNIKDNQTPGPVCVVRALDFDSGKYGDIKYRITAGGQNGLFLIDSSSGQLNVTQYIASNRFFLLTVLASDMGDLASLRSANVHITTINASSLHPVFSRDHYTFTTVENTFRLHPVGNVHAQFADASKRLTYSITSGDENKYFNISEFGELTTTRPIDHEKFNRFELTVMARTKEQLSLVGETKVTVLVDDLNDNSPSVIVPPLGISVMENTSVGSIIYKVRATDADSGLNGRLSYMLKQTYTDIFDIRSETGQIILIKSLLDTQPLFTLNIEVFDTGVPPRSTLMKLDIHIIDTNNNPPIFTASHYKVKIPNNSSINYKFLQVRAIDRDVDKNGKVSYKLETDGLGVFGMFPDGWLFVKQKPKSFKSWYTFSVLAYDFGRPQQQSTSLVTVFVEDINTIGTIFKKSSFRFSIMENSPVGTFIGRLAVMFPPIYINISYAFSSQNAFLQINKSSGMLLTNNLIDREAIVLHEGTDIMTTQITSVLTTSSRTIYDKCIIQVSVLDENDNSPHFLQPYYSVSVSESVTLGTYITQITAIDIDKGGNAITNYRFNKTSPFFRIDKNSGVISTLQTIDREFKPSHNLQIIGYDSRNTSMFSSVIISISVLDNNDNTPIFDSQNLTVKVNEATPVRYIIAKVGATDKDSGKNAFITYQIISGNENEVFGINANLGEVYLIKLLDFETKAFYTLSITAQDHGTPSKSSSMELHIHVEDFNDNYPTFNSEPSLITVNENTQLNTQIGRCHASDKDSDDNKVVKYWSATQIPENYFSINPIDCSISVAAKLDREKIEIFRITVKAEDQAINASQRLSSTKEITVLVTDDNDNYPFVFSPSFAPVSTSEQPPHVILKVNATDADKGENGTVQYAIKSELDSSFFQINQSSGELSLRSVLSNDPKLYYKVKVIAHDNGRSSLKTMQTITVFKLGQSNAGPVCASINHVKISENTNIGSSILQIQASYSLPISNSHLSYYLTTSDAFGYFMIDSLTGKIKVRQKLDFETRPRQFTLTVYAAETSGTLSRTTPCHVTVEITDFNDNSPYFNKSAFQILVPEDLNIGATLFNCVAYDLDSGQNGQISYKIENGNTGKKFRLDPLSGELSLRHPLDREHVAFYNLNVSATDNGKPPLKAYTTLHVKLEDRNDNKPLFNQSYYSFSVSEDAPMRTVIGKVSASDLDVGRNGQFQYDLVSHNELIFAVDRSTGMLTLNGKVDYELKQHYFLNISASDFGNPSLLNFVHVFINIIDVNDNCPIFSQSIFHIKVLENATVGTAVFQIEALDRDSRSNGQVTYIFSKSVMENKFDISKAGVISTVGELDRETIPFYILEVIAEDNPKDVSKRCSSRCHIHISVEDINDNKPEWNDPVIMTHASESLPVGQQVFRFSASDKDQGQNGYVTYKLLPQGDNEITPFRLENWGGLYLTSVLDYERKKSYNIQVLAEDHGLPSYETVVNATIIVEDTNDNSPIIEPHSSKVSLLENVTLGSTVITFTAVDADSGLNGRTSFTIISGNIKDSFAIEAKSGRLFVNKRLDREDVQNYTLDIEVNDQGVPKNRGITQIVISLDDINDYAPKFAQVRYDVDVLENLEQIKSVITFSANDLDIGKNRHLRYHLSGEKSTTDTFKIDTTMGIVRTLKSLDRETQAEYVMTVEATDMGIPPLSGKTTLVVHIKDQNDNSPEILPNNVTVKVRENLPAQTVVTTLNVTDIDSGFNAKLTSTLEINFGRFELQANTGILRLLTTTALNREVSASYQLHIVVSDHGTPSKTSKGLIVVIVEDENDSPPQFSNKRVTVKLQANVSIGSYVTKLIARDEDNEMNSKMRFSLMSGNISLVDIEQGTGVIFTKAQIPQGVTFQVEANVVDPGKPEFTDTAIVIISTANGFPYFLHGDQHLSVSESVRVGTALLMINASSPAVGLAGKIKYYISHGNSGGAFRVDLNSGQLFVSSPLDYETHRIYSLWVEARDSMNPPLSSFVKVIVSIINEDDSSPQFLTQANKVSIYESLAVGTSVIQMVATDPDHLSSSQRVRFKFSALSQHLPFVIDTVNGTIKTSSILDRENVDTYTLKVIAYAEDKPSLKSNFTLTINVLDINDNSPQVFSPDLVEVYEDIPLNTTIMTLNASDADIGSNSEMLFHTSSNNFQVDRIKGRLYLIKKLDREVVPCHRLPITVSDTLHVFHFNLSIKVLDINDSPPVFERTIYHINVSENLQPGHTFYVVKSTDKDLNLNAASEYQLEPRMGWGHFEINTTSGGISLSRHISYQKPKHYQRIDPNIYRLTVTARNIKHPFFTTNTSLLIQVTDYNNYSPVFSKNFYRSMVPSNAPNNRLVMVVSAVDDKDSEMNAAVKYTVTGGNGSSLFLLDESALRVLGDLKSFVNKVLVVQVRAYDLGTPSQHSFATVVIEVVEPNSHTPIFSPTSYQTTVEESYQVFKEVIKVTAYDQDVGTNGKILYSVLRGNSAVFGIGAENGSIFTLQPLDFETTTSYTLIIEAEDSATIDPKSSTARVSIHITDVNDNKPLFSLKSYVGFIVENAALQTSVLKVVATDKDISVFNVISYSILDSEGTNSFEIGSTNGILSSTAVLDYEQKSSYYFRVKATDNGNPQLSSITDVTIYVRGENEFSPSFLKKRYSFTVSEHTPPGQVIGRIEAEDLDKGVDGVCTFHTMQQSKFFVIDMITGEIRVLQKLLVGQTDVSVIVKNIDVTHLTPNNTDTAVVSIQVTDENDPPVFDHQIYNADVRENAVKGQFVIKISAVDPDGPAGSRPSYQLISGNFNNVFSLNTASGVLTVDKPLDRETFDRYNLIVSAKDQGIPRMSSNASVVIRVLDFNDNSPEIINCNGSVYENMSNGAHVLHINISDNDIDPNRGPFTFAILSATALPFAVDSRTGEIRTSSNLDREYKSDYDISIAVQDSGQPRLTGNGTCHVTVLDVSDTSPSPRDVLAVVNSLGEYFPGGRIGDVSPVDPDINDKYICTRLVSSGSQLFSFENSSCILCAASHRQGSILTVQYSASNRNEHVTSTARIEFISVKNTSINDANILRLHGVSLKTFVNTTFVSLQNFLQTLITQRYSILIISGKDTKFRILDLALILQSKTGSSVESQKYLKTLIRHNKASIERITSASSITPHFSPCVDNNPCLHNGECKDKLDINGDRTITNTQSVIFHSLNFDHFAECFCKPGYYGKYCQNFFQDCTPNPCRNFGHCVEKSGKYTCQCTPGFTGRYCEMDIPECVQKPCKNGGTCTETLGSFKCNCQSNYTGPTCETLIDRCKPNPCLNAGSCVSFGSTYSCNCKFGARGRHCEKLALTFAELSYLKYYYTSRKTFNFTSEVAMMKKNGLLLYGYHSSLNGASSPFIAIEVEGGLVKLSMSFGGPTWRVKGDIFIADGKWHTVSGISTNQVRKLMFLYVSVTHGLQCSVDDCAKDDGPVVVQNYKVFTMILCADNFSKTKLIFTS